MFSPPIIDVSALLRGGDPTAAARIHEACLHTGFFVMVAHGLDEPMGDVFAAANAFFSLDQATKERTPYVARYGYIPDLAHAIDRTRTMHVTEYLDLGLRDEVPMPDIEGFEAVVRRYQFAALAVATQVLRVMAVQLGAPPGFFDDHLDDPQCRLRFLHYLPIPPTADGTLAVPTAPHTDYGALTLLAVDGVPGLEVQPIGGEWTPVEAPAGALVVNIGDMLARWTNDRYRSTPHRVVASPERHRISIPFFVNPAPDTIVTCMPSCVSEDRPMRHAPIRAGDYLAARIDGTIGPSVDPAPPRRA